MYDSLMAVSSAVTITEIAFAPSSSEETVIPSLKSVSTMSFPLSKTLVTDAPEWFTVAVSVTVSIAASTSAA